MITTKEDNICDVIRDRNTLICICGSDCDEKEVD